MMMYDANIIVLQSKVVQLVGGTVTESFLSPWTPNMLKKSALPLLRRDLSKSTDGHGLLTGGVVLFGMSREP